MKAITGAIDAFRSGKGLKGQLLRGGVGSIAIKIASTGLNLVLAIVLARLLGAEGFGVYSFIFAIVTILAIPAQMGLPNLVVRETAKAQAAGRWDVIKGLWRWSTLMALGMSAALIVLGGAAAFLFADHFTPLQLQTFWWALALVPLIALGNLRGAALRGLRHVVWGQLPEFVLRPLFLITLSLFTILAWSSLDISADFAMFLHVLSAGLAFVLGAVLLARAVPSEMQSEKRQTTEQRKWFLSALPLALFTGIQVINMNIGIILTGSLSSAEEVGYLRIALQGATLVSFGLAAANMVISPYIAQMLEISNKAQLQRMLTTSARIVITLSSPVMIIYVLWGNEIISILFGKEFLSSYIPLVILTVGQFWNALMSSNDVLLNMASKEKIAVHGVIIGTIANSVICLILVPIIGGAGAAVAYTVSLITWNTYLWLKAWQVLSLDTSAFGWLPLLRNRRYMNR